MGIVGDNETLVGIKLHKLALATDKQVARF